jgi:glucosamine 6-phosphate synthetase-like amidotransferase/phosphosugar isomerase protein
MQQDHRTKKNSTKPCLALRACLLAVAPPQKQDVAMLELAKQLKDSNSLMFFARGNNYATALEAALKVGCHNWLVTTGL